VKKLIIATAIISALGSSSAFSADSNKPTSGAYGGIEIGYGSVKTVAADIAQVLANDISETVTYSYNKGVGVGRIYLGYTINENIATEIGFFGSTKLNTNYSSANGLGNTSEKARGGDLSILLRPSVSTGLNNAFLRLGAQYSKIDTSGGFIFDDGVTITEYGTTNENGTGFLIGAGYDTPIDKNMSARVSYTYIDNLGGVSGTNANLFSAGLKVDF
jgi:opacity protein-like surface antigen